MAAIISLVAGCKQSSADSAGGSQPPPPPGQTVARFHWVGKERVAADTNSARLMQIWRKPESARLRAHILDKLAAFLSAQVQSSKSGGSPESKVQSPESEAAGQSTVVAPKSDIGPVAPKSDAGGFRNPQSAIRTLLEDLVLKESYLEIRRAVTNAPAELAFAIRLDAARAAFWHTNLAAILESLTGTRPTQVGAGWDVTLDTRHSTLDTHFHLTRSQDWTILSLSSASPQLSTNSEFSRQLVASKPGTGGSTNWFEADLDPRRLAAALGLDWRPPDGAPILSLAVFGEGEDVRTRGELTFARTLPLDLEPWNVPAKLIGRQLLGFTAARGVAPLLRTFQPFSTVEPRAVPSQVYLWDDLGAPFHLYFALALTDATNLLDRIGPPLRDLINPRLTENCGSISIDTNASRLIWDGLHYASPFLDSLTNTRPQFLFGGFGPHSPLPAKVIPQEFLDHLQQGTNLVYYDFELTGQRLLHYRYLDDVYRILFDRHGPRLVNTASLAWIAGNLTNLSFAATELRREDDRRMSFARKSTVGLTGLEIEALANWIELPQFPRGLSTIMETNGTPIVRKGKIWQTLERIRQSTNAPPRKQ